MSTQESRHPVTYARNLKRRKRPLGVDLNVPPPTENREQEAAAGDAQSQVGPVVQQRGTLPPPIDVEAFDDDVIISSPRAFAEAKNKAGRPRGRVTLVDVDLEGPSSRATRIKRRRANHPILDADLYIILEGSASSVRENVKSVQVRAPPPPPPPTEPTFTCPVCISPLVEEMSTKCGHIFCKKCITSAINAQHKCPTCRRKISLKDTIRIYLPPTN